MKGFKVFFLVCAYIASFLGISMLIGWLICKGDPICASEMENFIDYYIWGIVPEWIALGWKWGVWVAVFPTIGAAWLLRSRGDWDGF